MPRPPDWRSGTGPTPTPPSGRWWSERRPGVLLRGWADDGYRPALGVSAARDDPAATPRGADTRRDYRIDPAHRRRGYARSALEILLATARADSRVSVVRATVSPDNTASRALIDQYGFREVGEQWDDEDGLEVILERDASHQGG
ncbi:GNAT family N-acetyltransferase [Lacisediminihabitans sp.]|uniref:GNAT family N-acetyltransferase n=1 Tax=Lacisediminihabitans sp. TaxID=2787631 RepID=UPI00374DB88B